MNYDLTDLRVLLAVIDEGNLSRGAARCHLAPSSASLRIKGLEQAVGTPLLHRLARGVGATPAGRVMAEHARRCIAQLEQMHADLMPFTQGMTGHVTLFANNNAISSFLPDDLARFFKAYPAVRISLEERLSHQIDAAVAEGRADVGVVALDVEYPELVFYPYRQDRLILLSPLDGRLGPGPGLSFSECLSEPFICLQQGAAMHTFLVNQATALGGKLDVRVQVSGYRAIAKLVGSGAGIGVIPRSAVEPGDEQRLRILEITDAWATRNLRICVRNQGEAQNHFQERLVQVLRGGQPESRT